MADNEPPSLSDLAGELAGDADVKEEAVAQDATTEESSTEETKTTEEEAAADSTESEDDGADASDTEETTEEDSEQSPAEQRKAQLNTDSANQASAVENQIKGQRNAERMLSAADPQSSASETKTVKQDPFLAGLTKGYGDRLSGN
jgi:wobble nucleotide-excising tRNase